MPLCLCGCFLDAGSGTPIFVFKQSGEKLTGTYSGLMGNAELTGTALRAGRLMVLIFPTVMVILNVSSVAVLWFGAGLVDTGQMQIGSLTA